MADFTEMNLFSFFGMEEPTPEPKKPAKKAVKEEKPSEVDLGTDDEDDIDDSDDDLVSEETTSKPAAPAKKKGGKKSVTGKDTITLPVTVYGRNFMEKVTSLEDATYNGLIKHLYDLGIKEVGGYNASIISYGDKIYIGSPQSDTNSDQMVALTRPVVICDGRTQCECERNVFSDMEDEEISVLHLTEKWNEVNGMYGESLLAYYGKETLAVPVLDEKVTKFKLPVRVNKFGAWVDVEADDFPLKETVTTDDMKEFLFPDCKATVTFKKGSEGHIFCEFSDSKNAVLSLNRDFAIQSGDYKQKTVVEKFSLPLNVYFATLGVTVELKEEHFGGKNRVTREEILDFMKPSYSILRNKDRHVELFYNQETSTVSIAVTSGKKGCSYTLPEAEETGCFKILHTKEEYYNALISDNCLGLYHGFDTTHRVEATPVATFIGKCGSGRLCATVQEVLLKLKTPKVPMKLFREIVADFKKHVDKERIVRIYWNTETKEFSLAWPEEEKADKVSISYRFKSVAPSMKLVATIHSHNTMNAYFSKTDDADEIMTGIYGVIGTVNKIPTTAFRVGMEGAYTPIRMGDLFAL